MMLTDLATAARKSGLTVIEIPGWRTHGHGQMLGVRTIVAHHTATAATAPGDYPSIGVVRNGREGLPGPLSQLGLGRDGTVYVIAAGLSYHAGNTHNRDQGNAYAIGIEAEHPGTGPWPKRQYDAYVRLCAALVEHYGIDVSRVQGHKEVATPTGRKSDPNFDMDAFRAEITDALQEDDMYSDADRERDKRIEEKLDLVIKNISNAAHVDKARTAQARRERAEILGEVDGEG